MIEYIEGDLFEHLDKYKKEGRVIFVPQINNSLGIWGSGFVIPVMKRWPEAYQRHKALQSPLGCVEYDQVEPGVWLLNMVAQDGIGPRKDNKPTGKRPLKYEHLVKCMCDIRKNILGSNLIKNNEILFLSPKFGSLRSGAPWEFIEQLIEEIWEDFKVIVFEYGEK